MSTANRKLTILAHAYDGVGHVNAVIGLVKQFQQRGHQVVFVATRKVQANVESQGIQFLALETEEENRISGALLKQNGILSGLATLEKLRRLSVYPITLRVWDQIVKLNDQMIKIVEQVRPDLILIDSFSPPPALTTVGVPWIHVYSSSALSAFESDQTPPAFSGKLCPLKMMFTFIGNFHFLTPGYATYERNDTKWSEFQEVLKEWHLKARLQIDAYWAEHGLPPIKNIARRWNAMESPYLNVYQYPRELDYDDVRPLPPKWTRCDSFGLGRYTEAEQQQRGSTWPLLTKEFLALPGKLIYFSLGTVGCGDTDLIERIARWLASLPHKVIVSKGTFGDKIDLSDLANVVSANHVPQLEIIPLVDLVVTHGGNNTFAETFALGKPMIVMPLFADQYDNAQRLAEKGFGVRMEPYDLRSAAQLEHAVNLLIDKADLIGRLHQVSSRVRKEASLARVADQILDLYEQEWSKDRLE